MLDPTDAPETSSGQAPWGTLEGDNALYLGDPSAGWDPSLDSSKRQIVRETP